MEPTPLNQVTGQTRTLTLGREQYTLAEIDLGVEGDYQNFLESRALDSVLSRREKLGAQFDEQLAQVNRDVNAFYYAFGGKGWAESLSNPPGAIELLRLCLAPRHPTLTTRAVTLLYRQHTKELWEALRSLNPTHFPQAPPKKDPPPGANGTPAQPPPSPAAAAG